MKMKNIICLLFAAFFSSSVFGQYDPEAKQVLDAMSERYKQVDAFTASFTQKLTNESADVEESVDGVVTVKNNMYKLEIADQEVYNDGKDIWTYNKEIAEATVSEFESDGSEISLSNIWDLYRDGYKYILLSTNKNGNRVVDLDPIDRTKTFFKVRMIINKSDELFSFTVFENSGNQYRYQILNFTERKDVTDAFFKFNPADYPNVEVIDFR